MHGCKGNQEILGIELATCAKTAPHLGLYEMNGALWQAGKFRKDAPVRVCHFGWTPHGEESPTFVEFRHQPPSLQRDGAVTLRGKFFLQDQIAAREGLVHVTHIDLEVGRDVVRNRVV